MLPTRPLTAPTNQTITARRVAPPPAVAGLAETSTPETSLSTGEEAGLKHLCETILVVLPDARHQSTGPAACRTASMVRVEELLVRNTTIPTEQV
jgi:hypothetical protein